jgi:hypothetical protein
VQIAIIPAECLSLRSVDLGVVFDGGQSADDSFNDFFADTTTADVINDRLGTRGATSCGSWSEDRGRECSSDGCEKPDTP